MGESYQAGSSALRSAALPARTRMDREVQVVVTLDG